MYAIIFFFFLQLTEKVKGEDPKTYALYYVKFFTYFIYSNSLILWHLICSKRFDLLNDLLLFINKHNSNE